MKANRLFPLTLAAALCGSLLLGQQAQAQDWRKQFPKFRYGVQAVET